MLGALGVGFSTVPAYAGAFCSGTNMFCEPSRDLRVGMSVSVNGVQKNNGDVIVAGDRVDVNITYRLNTTASGGISTWIKFDSTDQQFGGLDYNTPGAGFRLGAINGGDPGGCPSFFYAEESPYYNPAVGSTRAGDDFPPPPWDPFWTGWSSDLADGNGWMTCGSEGQAAIWYNAQNAAGSHNPDGSTGNYTAQFRVNPETQNSANICIRGYISKDFTSKLQGRSPNDICLHVVPIRISGSIKSDPTNATGKGLASVGLAFSRSCTGSYRDIGTNPNGDWELEPGNNATRYQKVCMRLPVNVSSGGTSYTVIGGHSGSWYDGGYYYVPVQCSDVPGCEYQFYYNPTPQNPAMAKSVNVGNGTNLKPGDTVSYTVTATNDIDSNSPSMVIEDNIPLNIDPSSVVVTSLSASTTGGAPTISGLPWRADGGLPCAPGVLSYGYQAPSGWRTKSTSTGCAILDNPRRISISMDRLPAYSQVTFTWTGRVKSAEAIGLDRNGLQGVYNTAAGGVNGNLPSASNEKIYNPIPGDITCVAKSAVAEMDTQGNLRGKACEAEVTGGVPYDSYIYSARPDLPSFNQATIKIEAFADKTKGPVEYYVKDQNNGAIPGIFNDPDTYTPDRNRSLDARTVYWGQAVGCRQWWPEQRCPTAGTPQSTYGGQEYMFHSYFNNTANLAYGATTTNTARVCWRQLWIAGYPEACRDSNPIQFRLAKIDQPYYDTALGGVHAGGGVADATSGPCNLDTNGTNQLRDNPGGQGWFMVSTVENQAPYNVSSVTGLNSYGTRTQQCRPDLVKRLRYLTTPPLRGQYLWGSALSRVYDTDEALTNVNNKIVTNNPGAVFKLGNNSTIPGTAQYGNGSVGDSEDTIITKRWTLFVDGDLYIAGNVKYQDNAGNKLGESPSFGVVVTGNIYIDPSVTQLDGYYYAQGTTNGSIQTKGIINTCASATSLNDVKTLSRGFKRDGVADLSTPPTPGYSVTECSKRLRVNGVMFGRSFRFNRVPKNVGSRPEGPIQSEEIVFSNRLILATPPGFSDLAAQFVRTSYQGERAPRY